MQAVPAAGGVSGAPGVPAAGEVCGVPAVPALIVVPGVPVAGVVAAVVGHGGRRNCGTTTRSSGGTAATAMQSTAVAAPVVAHGGRRNCGTTPCNSGTRPCNSGGTTPSGMQLPAVPAPGEICGLPAVPAVIVLPGTAVLKFNAIATQVATTAVLAIVNMWPPVAATLRVEPSYSRSTCRKSFK